METDDLSENETGDFVLHLPSIGIGVLAGGVVTVLGGGVTAVFFGIGIFLGSHFAVSGRGEVYLDTDQYAALAAEAVQRVGGTTVQETAYQGREDADAISIAVAHDGEWSPIDDEPVHQPGQYALVRAGDLTSDDEGKDDEGKDTVEGAEREQTSAT